MLRDDLSLVCPVQQRCRYQRLIMVTYCISTSYIEGEPRDDLFSVESSRAI